MWRKKPPEDLYPGATMVWDLPFIICETVAAISYHVRLMGTEPANYGGGLKTLAECGAKVSWDTRIPVALDTITCRDCKAKFKEIIGGNQSKL